MLTRKQYDLLMFIHKRVQRDGVSPSFDEMKEALSEALFHNRLRGRAHQAQLRNNLANTLQRFVSRKLGINPTVMGTVIHLDPSVTRAEGGKRKR